MQRKVFTFLLAFAAVVMFGSTAQAQQKFTAALNTIQEVPPPTNSLGRGSCVITLNTAETQISATCEYSGLSSGLISGHIHGNAAPGVNAGILFNFNPPTGSTSGTFNAGPFNVTPAQVASMRAKLFYVNLHTTNFPGGEIRGQVKIQTTPYDNDGDGRTDIRVYRPSAFTTYGINSINNTLFANIFGFAGESPVFVSSASDDYDGDGRGDIVLTRVSGSNIVWRILQTGSNSVREMFWGLSTDREMPADYDGDGKTDIAVYRSSNAFWYVMQSSNNQLRAENWGSAGNLPIIGDFDKDGRNDFTIVRGVTGSGVGWFTRRSSDGGLTLSFWGGAPAPGGDFIFPNVQVDIDGDGIQDRMVVRDPNAPTENPANNTGDQMTYFIQRSSNNTAFVLPFGLDTDARFFGDYDGDGRTDLVARRNIGGQLIWFIYQSSNAQTRVVNFGSTGDSFADDGEDEGAESVLLKDVE
jgi:hypothetical protein